MSENESLKIELCVASVQRLFGVSRLEVESLYQGSAAYTTYAIYAAYNYTRVSLNDIAEHFSCDVDMVEITLQECGISRMVYEDVEWAISTLYDDLKKPLYSLNNKSKA